MEDGTLPHEASIEEGRINKERRLFYEGITRAKERPRLSHTKGSTALGRHPRRFLNELPATDAEQRRTPGSRRSTPCWGIERRQRVSRSYRSHSIVYMTVRVCPGSSRQSGDRLKPSGGAVCGSTQVAKAGSS